MIDDIAMIAAICFWPVVGSAVLLSWIANAGEPKKKSAPPPSRGLTKEEEARDAIAGDIVGREMGWWD